MRGAILEGLQISEDRLSVDGCSMSEAARRYTVDVHHIDPRR
jgi:hypothetical protein